MSDAEFRSLLIKDGFTDTQAAVIIDALGKSPEQAARMRAREIAALCRVAGKADRTLDLIASGATFAQAQAALVERPIERVAAEVWGKRRGVQP